MSITVLSETRPQARKNHICYECGCLIPKGTVHYVQVNVWDGQVNQWRVHADCAELYWALTSEYRCSWDDALPTMEYCLSEIEQFRGRFPHAVCRQELSRGRHARMEAGVRLKVTQPLGAV